MDKVTTFCIKGRGSITAWDKKHVWVSKKGCNKRRGRDDVLLTVTREKWCKSFLQKNKIKSKHRDFSLKS